MLAELRTDELDCAFAALDPDALGDEFAATLLWKDELVVALAPEHRLCAKPAITFEELAAEDLIAYRENSALRRRLERAMAALDLEPRKPFICTEMAAVRGLASKGLGVAVMPRTPDLADRAGLASDAPSSPGRQGVHRRRPQVREGERAAGLAGGVGQSCRPPRRTSSSASTSGSMVRMPVHQAS